MVKPNRLQRNQQGYKCDIWPRALYISLIFDIEPVAPFNTINLLLSMLNHDKIIN